MRNALKSWSSLRESLASRTSRLALSYLAVIMIMSLSCSALLYRTSSRQLDRQVPPTDMFIQPAQTHEYEKRQQDIGYFFEERAEEGRHALIAQLFFINTAVLLGGIALSYFLARLTLRPIEAAIEAQSRFVGDASHELRTPLTAIQTNNEVILRRKQLTLDAAREALKSNIEEISRLKDLTDSLLSLAKQEQPALNLAPVDLQDVVTTAMNHVIPAAQARDITIEDKSSRITVTTSKDRLEQVLIILFDNAIKYSPKQSAITVSTTARSKHCTISVKDTGIGIRATEIPHIFKRFYRADQARTKTPSSGYGLGLSIAANIIRQLHGDISVQSELGKGSVFTIKLPLR